MLHSLDFHHRYIWFICLNHAVDTYMYIVCNSSYIQHVLCMCDTNVHTCMYDCVCENTVWIENVCVCFSISLMPFLVEQ